MPGSKLLFVSYDGLIADIAWQVTREGHQAKLFIQDEEERGIADGLAPKCDDWRREVDWADVVVFDDARGPGAASRWACGSWCRPSRARTSGPSRAAPRTR